MAIAEAFMPFDMNEAVWFGSVTSATPTEFTVTDGFRSAHYTGMFTYPAGLPAGTVTAIQEWRGGIAFYTVTGVNIEFSSLANSSTYYNASSILFAGDDTFTGSDGDENVWVFDGADLVNGGLGNDIADAGSGNDTINGDDGNDVLFGGAGDDELNGGPGADLLQGGPGADAYDGGAGNDTIQLAGDERGVSIEGGDQIDTIELQGDILVGNFLPNGIEQIDTRGFEVNGTGPIGSIRKLDLRGLTNVGAADVVVNAGQGEDAVWGTNQDDVLNGGYGNDTLRGGRGDDTLIGGYGLNVLKGGQGNDTFVLDLANDIGTIVNGGSGIDTIEFSRDIVVGNFAPSGVERIFTQGNVIKALGGVPSTRTVDLRGLTSVDANGLAITAGVQVDAARGTDIIFGTDQDDTLNGSFDDDSLSGWGGGDRLFGGPGSDTMRGGEDDDRLWGEDEADVLFGGKGHDTIKSGNGEDKLVGGDGNDHLEGAAGHDTLKGGNGHDTLQGNRGDDLLVGEGWADRLSGGLGDDTLWGGRGSDTLLGGDQDDFLEGNQGNDLLKGQRGSDSLFGGEGNDTLLGGRGDDTLGSSSGLSTLDGGQGDDTFYVAAGMDTLRFKGDFGSDAVLACPSEGTTTILMERQEGEAQTRAEFVSAISQVGDTLVYDAGSDGQNTITFKVLPAPIEEERDQGQVFDTDGVVRLGTSFFSQSVTVGTSGFLARIEFLFEEWVPDQSLQLSIYAGGHPVGEPPLHSETVFLPGDEVGGEILYQWSIAAQELDFDAGDEFVFSIQAAEEGAVLSANDPPGYQGGVLYEDGIPSNQAGDLAFITYMAFDEVAFLQEFVGSLEVDFF